MKKDSIIDYLSYIAVKVFGGIIRLFPVAFSLFLARRLGELWYGLSAKQRNQVYVNIKNAFQGNITPFEIRRISRAFFRNLACNFIEALYITKVDKHYLDKYIQLEGQEYIRQALNDKKGAILLGVHAGSWELANTVPAILGFSYNIFVRRQKHSRLDELLNSYRALKGCRLITRGSSGMRDMVRALRNNEVLGTVCDQGGKAGVPVKFFGKEASMSTLAVRLALKWGCKILPVFCLRIRGPYNKIIVHPPFALSGSGDIDKNAKENLERLSRVFEQYILKYPQEYFWLYKIWKYSNERKMVILSDGETTGHLRQAQALAGMAKEALGERDLILETETVEVKFRSGFAKKALNFSCALAGRYSCQGCLWCFRTFLEPATYKALMKLQPDYVVSCGSSLAAVNYVFSRENLAQAIAIMRPSIFSIARFDMVLMPRHDNPHPRKNVIVTEGALNMVDERYLKSNAQRIGSLVKLTKETVLGVLLGGDTKDFELSAESVKPLVSQIKSFLEKYDGELLITTSRRTGRQVEDLIRQEFAGYNRCKLMVIANEKNIPEAVGGILALSSIIIASPESISMVSEAASSGKCVVVFDDGRGLGGRHRFFLGHFARRRYIYLTKITGISVILERIIKDKPRTVILNDRQAVKEALQRKLR